MPQVQGARMGPKGGLAAGGIHSAARLWRVVHAPQAKGLRPLEPHKGKAGKVPQVQGARMGPKGGLAAGGITRPKRCGVWFVLRRPKGFAPWNPIKGKPGTGRKRKGKSSAKT